MNTNRWLVLAVLTLARTAMAMQFQTVGSVGADLVGALTIDYAGLGALIGLYMLPGVVMGLPGGLIGQRFGAKHATMAGMVLMVGGGLLTGADASFGVVAAGRLISGTGAVLLNVMVTKMVADWFAGREIVTAMSLLIASWPLGIGLGLVVYVPLAAAVGWAAVMSITAAALLACLVPVALVYRDPPGAAPAEVGGLALDLTRREWLLVSLAAMIWGTYNVAYIVFVSFAPALLSARGYSPALASSFTSLVSWSLIASIPISGLLAERLRRPNLFMVGGLLGGALAAIALAITDATVAAFIGIAVVVGLPAGLIMALPAQVLRPQARASGMGVFYTLFYAAMAALPGIAGMARDLSGGPTASVLFAAAMLIAALVFLLAFRAAQHFAGVPRTAMSEPETLAPVGRAVPSPPLPGE